MSRCAALAALALVTGCQAIAGFHDFEPCRAGESGCTGTFATGGASGVSGGSSSSGGRGGASGATMTETGGNSNGGAATGGATGTSCTVDPGKHHPEMAAVANADGQGCFWIDTTEVTIGDYDAFVSSGEGKPGDPVCPGATSDGGPPDFAPVATCVAKRPELGGGANDGNFPVTCVDWCDAAAYCAWAGKTLCSDPSNGIDSEFVQACTQGRKGAATYGCEVSGCSDISCNGHASGNGAVLPVATATDCYVTGMSGQKIYDLSGNVAEWTEHCSPNLIDGSCNTRGGAFDSEEAALECGSSAGKFRTSVSPEVGFRCCVNR